MWSIGFLLLGAAYSQNIGQWSQPIKFPLVPVAASTLPGTGKIVTWSAMDDNAFAVGAAPRTQVAVYDPADGSVVHQTVTATGADSFCPGINMDFNGRLIVTGGDSPDKTSLVSANGQWSAGPPVAIPRGYQSSTTLSNGKSWMIGGSWSGSTAAKNGEIFDGNQWTVQPGCDVTPMKTADPQGNYRNDNHGMLFARSNGSVFQAGPSKRMNWYFTDGQGRVSGAGNRGNDGDAMCGPAAMYDAAAGKILVVGGSPAYQDAEATTNAHLITIGAPGSQAQVQNLTPMKYKRTYATSTILPDGSIFIVGGQTYGVPFSDANSSLTPELWNPQTQQFTDMATQGTPRNYHSVALLTADAKVFSGGGGLCGPCKTNHFDAELFSPPYLFEADGKTLAKRPTITQLSATTAGVGDTLTVTLDSNAKAEFALIRYGSSTHTVNTDQRRIPLTPTAASKGNSHVLQLPDDLGVILPGYWYVFALVNGVPSVGKTIKITP